MALKFKDLTRSLSVLSPKRSRRRRASTTGATAPDVGEMGELKLDGVASGSGPASPTSQSRSGSTGRSPFRLPSGSRNAASFTGSRRSRRKISITISADADGRRALKLYRRRKDGNTPLVSPRVASSPEPLSRATSWVTLSTGKSPSMSPHSLSPVSGKFPVPLDLPPPESSSSSTTVVTPTSILMPGITKTPPEADGKSAGKVSPSSTCLLERLYSPAAIERRPSRTKKPAPGGVYVFDVVSEESPQQPIAPDKDADRNARLQKSAQRAPLAYRLSPWSRVVNDVIFLFSHLGCIPTLFVPCRRHGPSAVPGPGAAESPTAMPPSTSHCRGHMTDGTKTQLLLLVLSVVVTILGAGSLLACMPTVAALLLLVLLAEHIQGPTTRDSKRPDVKVVPGAEREAWFFVNGMAATPEGTQEVIDHLHGLVRRPITALMNRSLGLWFDFLQSILQRNLFLPTRDLRHGYKYVHEAIMNSSHDRIVLVAHSQGGIIVSAWVDQLIADLHPSLLTRVEVYTFGSAASHFALRADGEGAFARIEHFANMHDLVAQFGVLDHARGGGYAPPRPGAEDDVRAVYGRYVGRVFARNRTGHMLLDHYLHPSDSILDEPAVKSASRFAAYVGGGNLLSDEPRPRGTSAAAFATSVKRDARTQLGIGSPAGTPHATPTKSR